LSDGDVQLPKLFRQTVPRRWPDSGETDGQTDRQTDGWIDDKRQTEREGERKNRQTTIHTHTKVCRLTS